MSYQRDYENRLRIGVIGLGSHAYRNILPATNYLPVELTAFCDIDEAQLRKTGRQYGVDRLYTDSSAMLATEDLDAVFIVVGPRQHPALAIEALAAGIPVWMEKPPALRAAEIRNIMAAAGDLPVVVGFKKAFMPAVTKVREILAREDSGALVSILGEYPMSMPADGPAILAEGRITNWLANGVHPLSAMMALGGPVEAVTTLRNRFGAGAVLLHFANGATGNLHLSSGPGVAPRERYSIHAEHAHAVIENSARVIWHRGIPFQYARTTSAAPPGDDSGSIVWEPQNTLSTLENKAEFVQGIAPELLHFCECVLEKRAPERGDLRFTLQAMQAYEAALLSDGHPVDLASID